MKIKKMFIYGMVLLLVLISLAGCSGKAPDEEVEMGTPEGVVIAYLQWFSEEDFDEVEGMLEMADSVGDVYFVQSQQPPKTKADMVKSQHEFITHFYGDNAWIDVSYELEPLTMEDIDTVDILDTVEPDSEAVTSGGATEYRADFVFNKTPHHLMGYENIHIILSNESGAWMVKEGLSWDKNLYGGKAAPEYFKGSEAFYRGVNVNTQPEDIINQFGESISQMGNAENLEEVYILESQEASFYFIPNVGEDGSLLGYYLESIVVYSGNYSLPRNIKLGDSFYSVMEKFPREKDWLSDPNQCFYGTDTLEGFGGACFTYKDEDGITYESVVLVPVEYTPYFKMEFTDGVLESAMLVYIQMQ